MNKLYHLSFWFPGVPKMRDLEEAFSAPADDWIRVNPNIWIIWSAEPPNDIYSRIVSRIDVNDSFLMTELQPGKSIGVLPIWAWNWANSKNPGSFNVIALPAPPAPALPVNKKW